MRSPRPRRSGWICPRRLETKSPRPISVGRCSRPRPTTFAHDPRRRALTRLMATFFKTVVLMSGGLLSCGANTDNGKAPRGSGATPAPDSAPDTAPPNDAADTSSEDLAPAVSAAPASSEPTAGDPDDEPAVAELDCPTEEWTCGATNCERGDVGTCPSGNFCSFAPPASCSCTETPAPEVCAEGQTRTCLFGQFGPRDNSASLRFDCRCLPQQPDCNSACSNHPNAPGRYATCREMDGVIECGGCLIPGILR